MDASDTQLIRALFDDYMRMYSTRDDRLTEHFSEDFSGFTGGNDFLVKDRAEWVAITRQDFAQVKDAIRIEFKDMAFQSLADTIAVATSTFVLHLPIDDHVLSRKTARLVLIFRKEILEDLEKYVGDRTEAMFSHGICPDCCERLYPQD